MNAVRDRKTARARSLVPEFRFAIESHREGKSPASTDLSLPEADPSSAAGADRARADPSSGERASPNFAAKGNPSSGVGADRAKASRNSAAKADLSFEAGADLNSGAKASPSSAAKADLSSGAEADRAWASLSFEAGADPNSAAKADLNSGARTMPAGPSSLAEKGLPSRSGRSLADDLREVGKRARVNSELGPRRNRGPRLLAAQETGKAGRAQPSPGRAFKPDPHSEIARRGPKGLVHRAESLVEVLVAQGSRDPEAGRISSDQMLRSGLEAREASARVPGVQAGRGAAELGEFQIPTGKGGMAPWALASATTASRFSRTSSTVIVYSSRCAS